MPVLCVTRILPPSAVVAGPAGGNGLMLKNIHTFLTNHEGSVKVEVNRRMDRKRCCLSEFCDWTPIARSIRRKEMGKNKIIVTGLAVGSDADPESCQSCNFDMSWIFDYPSTLLWADSILITPTIQKTFQSADWPDEPKICGSHPVAEVKRMFFDKAGEAGLIEVRDPTKDVDDALRNVLRTRVEQDRSKLATMFPAAIKLDIEDRVPGSMQIEGIHYCTPRILSLYYSMFLADRWGAQPLLNELSYTYLKYSFGIRAETLKRTSQSIESFRELFREQLPEIDIRPHMGEKNCWSCANGDGCEKAEVKQIEKRLSEYLRLRDYDEVHQMKALHIDLASKVNQIDGQGLMKDIQEQFLKTKKLLNRRMNKLFPVAMRWSNLTTVLSIPVAVAGISTHDPLTASIGAGIAGLSQIAKQYMEFLTSKNRWLCFRQNCGESKRSSRKKPNVIEPAPSNNGSTRV